MLRNSIVRLYECFTFIETVDLERFEIFLIRKILTNLVKYLAAYLLLVNAGNTSPSAADVKSVLESVSIEVEEDKISKLLEEVEGKNVEELIAEGNAKLSSVPSGGAAASSGGAAAASGDAPAEEAKEEEAAEESDDDMGFGLFD
ncbi:uncharacterized protein PRCAT00004133001 [Priceomyces carsonii]|uniref:uncharacterized protein n=1 Tax=Priceomyces carsonii TaxID=28549 RepID=UPI002ED92519|nr:unnamed protein product [Priceomyces carsonii]